MTLIDSLTTTKWEALGPSPIDAAGVGLGRAAGRVEAAATVPGHPEMVYACGSDGGIWKTQDFVSGAPRWTPLTDRQVSLNTAGYHPLAVHPADHHMVLGGVSGHGAGVLVSTDGGGSWTLKGNAVFDWGAVASISVHPTNTSVMYAALWSGAPLGGVWKSTDGGQNWTNTTGSVHSGPVSDVVVASDDGHTLYAGLLTGSSAGVWKSTDSGGSWHRVHGLPEGSKVGTAIRLEACVSAHVVYVAIIEAPVLIDVAKKLYITVVRRWRTHDGGQTWHELATTGGTVETRSWHLLLGVDPDDAKHVFVNDAYELWESHDSGQTWKHADVVHNTSIGDDWVNLSWNAPGVAIVTADRDIYRYQTKPKTWKSREGNLQISLFYDITPDPNDPNTVYGIAQDHPFGIRFKGTHTWAYLSSGGETGKVLVHPQNSATLYVANPLTPSVYVTRSTDGGSSWKTIWDRSSDLDDANYDRAYPSQRAFAMNHHHPDRLLIGIREVWETKNASAATPTWKAISSPLSAAADHPYILALAIAPSDPKIVYVATGDGHLWVTEDGGAHWNKRDSGIVGAVVDIRVHPTDPHGVLAVSGWGPGIWALDTSGSSWHWNNVAGDMPNTLSVGTIHGDWHHHPARYFVGTTSGVWCSSDQGAHWTEFAKHMPHTNVTDLQAAGPILYAGTFGRSVWAIRLRAVKDPPPTVGPFVAGPAHVAPGDPVEHPGTRVPLLGQPADLLVLPGRTPGQPLARVKQHDDKARIEQAKV
jgi:photosystem II stability/assembly factor-like uncharacterized protein